MASREKDKPPHVTERVAFIGDVHIPLQDNAAVRLVMDFLPWFKPDIVFLIGDILDCEAISKHRKKPDRKLLLQEELNSGKEFLSRLRRAVPKARIKYLAGNHEVRLEHYLWEHEEVERLDALQWTSLLGLDDLKIEWYDYYTQLQWNGLLIEHGDRIRGKSAYTAAAMLEMRGISGISGHTHRLGAHYRTDHAGTRVWFENGHLRTRTVDWIAGIPNWQQGFTVGYGVKGRTRFVLEQLPILSGRLFYQGKLWGSVK